MFKLRDDVAFEEWPKIPRGQHETITITEKIDGSNACIVIADGEIVSVQSRKRKISPSILSGEKGSDNAGFALWVMENTEDLLSLGDGYHYGEWAGPSVQKNPRCLEEMEFYLFNSYRWGSHNPNTPECCQVVPTLYVGKYTEFCIRDALLDLEKASEGTGERPEGVIAFFHKTRRYEKHTFANQKGKWRDD